MRLSLRLLVLFILLMVSVPPIFAAPPSQASDDVTQIETLIDNMESAVLAQDKDLYLSYVDLSEPHFAREHTRWAEDWSNEDFLTAFELRVNNVRVEGNVAMGTLALEWETSLAEQPGQLAIFPVEFHKLNGQWFYAGEFWLTTETEHFIVRVIPGLESAVDRLIPNLPAVYAGVTTAYGYEPDERMMIKLYPSRQSLGAVTLLSLPLIRGWNEPGESLKSIGTEPGRLSGIVAHEFTHFLSFDQVGGESYSQRPWWLEEGIAQYFAEPLDERGSEPYTEALLLTKDWLAAGELVDWRDMAVFDETPVEYWQYVYPQGYTFVRFLTEEYGQETRNKWLHAMSDVDIDVATETIFWESFDELDVKFRAWLEGYTLD